MKYEIKNITHEEMRNLAAEELFKNRHNEFVEHLRQGTPVQKIPHAYMYQVLCKNYVSDNCIAEIKKLFEAGYKDNFFFDSLPDNEQFSFLGQSIKHNNIELIDFLVDNNLCFLQSSLNQYGDSCLLLAAYYGRVEIFKKLLDSPTNIFQTNYKNQNILSMVLSESDKKTEDMANILFSHSKFIENYKKGQFFYSNSPSQNALLLTIGNPITYTIIEFLNDYDILSNMFEQFKTEKKREGVEVYERYPMLTKSVEAKLVAIEKNLLESSVSLKDDNSGQALGSKLKNNLLKI